MLMMNSNSTSCVRKCKSILQEHGFKNELESLKEIDLKIAKDKVFANYNEKLTERIRSKTKLAILQKCLNPDIPAYILCDNRLELSLMAQLRCGCLKV